MIKHIPFILLISISILSGCAHTGKNQTIPYKKNQPALLDVNHIPVAPNISNPSLLEYMGNFIELPIETQRKELANITLIYMQDKNDIDSRIKAAMIYGFSSSRLRESVKAQLLLDELIREKKIDTERNTLLILLRDHINENSKLSQRVRDEQKRADVLQQKTESQQQKLDEALKRADSLQKKLDDLINIEKTMMNRKQRALQ